MLTANRLVEILELEQEPRAEYQQHLANKQAALGAALAEKAALQATFDKQFETTQELTGKAGNTQKVAQRIRSPGRKPGIPMFQFTSGCEKGGAAGFWASGRLGAWCAAGQGPRALLMHGTPSAAAVQRFLRYRFAENADFPGTGRGPLRVKPHGGTRHLVQGALRIDALFFYDSPGHPLLEQVHLCAYAAVLLLFLWRDQIGGVVVGHGRASSFRLLHRLPVCGPGCEGSAGPLAIKK